MPKKRKKINPRRIPISEADLKRRQSEGQNQAIMVLGAIAFVAVSDVFKPKNPTPEQEEEFQKKLEEWKDKFFLNAEMMAKGTVKYEDYAEVLMEDNGIELNFE